MQLKRLNRYLAAFFCGISLCLTAAYVNAATQTLSPQLPQLAVKKPISLNPFKQMNSIQQHSFKLLLQNYQDCFQIRLEPSPHADLSNTDLPNAFSINIFEKHNQDCGGDPNTMPRRASYLIDDYGRIFYQNMVDNTLDLQFQFKEVPVIITDMALFRHPTKTVFANYGIQLQKVEKRAVGSFVIFYVADVPLFSDTRNKPIAQTRQQLFQQLLKANGGWDFMIRSEEGHEYYIEGNKRQVIDKQSYGK